MLRGANRICNNDKRALSRRCIATSLGRHFGIDTFWELVDEILNAFLFVLIGLEILVLTFTHDLLLGGLVAIPAILFARWASVGLPVWIMSRWKSFMPGTVTIMTWGRTSRRYLISIGLIVASESGAQNDCGDDLCHRRVFNIVSGIDPEAPRVAVDAH